MMVEMTNPTVSSYGTPLLLFGSRDSIDLPILSPYVILGTGTGVLSK